MESNCGEAGPGRSERVGAIEVATPGDRARILARLARENRAKGKASKGPFSLLGGPGNECSTRKGKSSHPSKRGKDGAVAKPGRGMDGKPGALRIRRFLGAG